MTKKEDRLLAFLCLFLGMVLGFLMAPIKAGVSCGNNNTISQNMERRPRRERKNREAAENGEETDCAF